MKLLCILLLPVIGSSVASAQSMAGLWSGEITFNKVNEVHFRQTTGTTPTPTAAPMTIRVLLHVNAAGQAQILKEAVLMKTVGPVPAPVVVTQLNLLPTFQGIVERSGKLVGRRFSTSNFAMATDTQPMTGPITVGGTSTATVVLPADSPVNPFRHKYHPDLQNGGIAVSRAVSLGIAPGENPADHILEGTWTEAITGLHLNPIHLSGKVTLTRVSTVATLNNQ